MKVYFNLFFTLLIILILNSCINKRFDSYKETLKRQKVLESDTSGNFVQTNSGVTLTVKSLNGQESETLFDVNLIKKGYIPIYLHINNKTNQTLYLRKSYIDLNLCSSEEIAKQMHYNTSLYGWSLGLPAFWFYWPAAVAVGALSYNMSNSNKDINDKIEHCTYHDSELKIMPYESTTKFIFVYKLDFRYNFNISLFNLNQEKLYSFNVNLIKF